MNEKKICACVGARTRDTQKSKEHYEENFIPAGWNLEYTCLDQPEAARALYLTGVCLHCGGQLGKKFNIPGELIPTRAKPSTSRPFPSFQPPTKYQISPIPRRRYSSRSMTGLN